MVVPVVYGLNGLWFTAAFVQFSLAQRWTLRILVPREARGDRLAPTLSASVNFLGGMNAALAALCFVLAFGGGLFASPTERAVMLGFLALANFSQFACNLPVLVRGGRRDVAYWPVLSGPMLRIFVIDALLMVIDCFLAMQSV